MPLSQGHELKLNAQIQAYGQIAMPLSQGHELKLQQFASGVIDLGCPSRRGMN